MFGGVPIIGGALRGLDAIANPKTQPANPPPQTGNSGFFGNVFGGISSALGSGIGRGISNAASGAIGRATGLIPKPEGRFDPAASADRELIRLDKLYPGTNPWERLGVNAASPTEIASQQGRNQERVAHQQAKVALATNGAQIDAQQKIAAAQLSTQETLKRAELATSKDIAQLQGRASIINGTGAQNPAAVPQALKAFMTGDYKPDPSYTGQYGLQSRKLDIDTERLKLEIRRAPDERKLLRVKQAAEMMKARAAKESAEKAGGQYALVNFVSSKAYKAVIEAWKAGKGNAETLFNDLAGAWRTYIGR